MINDYNEVRECVYKDESYSVRDNGAVMRNLREGKKARKDDGVWTFGIKNSQNGYMYIGTHRVHVIVATAFLGVRDSKVYVVDHKDTNRCNNRIENLHWFTRLENAINNPITRNKIIYICGSLEAFIENPGILRERLQHVKKTSLNWMRTVTKEEAKIAYENVKKYWEEQAKNPKPLAGGVMNDSVYHQQSNVKIGTPIDIKNNISTVNNNSNKQYIISDEEWEHSTRSLWNPMPQISEVSEPEVEESYIMSLTPNAAQYTYHMNDKPCYYPSTPQKEGENPLQTYYDALVPGSVFWKNHERKRDYIVEKRDFSGDGKSLVIMTKASYVWMPDKDGKMVETPIYLLSNSEYDNKKINWQLNEVIYKNGIYIHSRPEVGFMPFEYLEKKYNEKINKK